MLFCYLCGKKFTSALNIIKHLKIQHGLTDNKYLVLKCCSLNCIKKFKTFNGFRKHLKGCDGKSYKSNYIQETKENDNISCIASKNINSEINSDGSIIGDDNIDLNNYTDNGDNIYLHDEFGNNPIKFENTHKVFEGFIFNLISLKIADSLTQSIIHGLKDLLHYLLEDILDRTKNLNSDLLQHIVREYNKALNIFDTIYKRKKYFASQIVNPKKIAIGTHYKQIWNSKFSLYVQNPVTTTFSYISLLETLHVLFCNKSYYNTFFSTRNTNTQDLNTIEKFADGSKFKNCELFQNDSHAIQIQIFFDEFETVNPLGSKTSKHKLGGIYFIIGNLPPHFNSSLQFIHLLALFHSSHIKKGNFDKILSPIVKELSILETEGILVDNKRIRGTLVALSHDNLGANMIHGMVESFSSHYCCRMCFIHKDDLKTCCNEKNLELRNHNKYLQLCEQLINVSTENHIMGQKRKTILDDLNYFKVFDSQSVDIMHDLLEGVCQLEIKLFLKYLVKNNIITLANLNKRIECFQYGYIERCNKPSPISLDKHGHLIGQRAAQTWCLIRFLPLILDDLLNSEIISKWNVLILLLEIMDIVFSDKITIGMTLQLQNLIEEHHKLFLVEFDLQLLPKHHFMVHYPRLIREMGPLIQLWTMRFESKHSFFTNMIKKIGNYKDLCQTLAQRHQEQVLAQWKNKTVQIELKFGTGKYIVLSAFEHANVIGNYFQIPIDYEVFFVSWIEYIFHYKKKYMLCTGILSSNDMPIFEEIIYFFIFNEKPYAVCIPWETIDYPYHLHSYLVQKFVNSKIINIVDITSLCHKLPYEVLQSQNNLSNNYYIVPKHSLVI